MYVYVCKNAKIVTIVTGDQQEKLMLPWPPTHQCE